VDAQSWVYILASRRNGTLYTGVTTNLLRRVWEHREGFIPGFTKTYDVKRLVWFETYGSVVEAIAREKAIKRWRRAWKLALIEAENPQWLDLYESFS
jgi:putative endonuclease